MYSSVYIIYSYVHICTSIFLLDFYCNWSTVFTVLLTFYSYIIYCFSCSRVYFLLFIVILFTVLSYCLLFHCLLFFCWRFYCSLFFSLLQYNSLLFSVLYFKVDCKTVKTVFCCTTLLQFFYRCAVRQFYSVPSYCFIFSCFSCIPLHTVY